MDDGPARPMALLAGGVPLSLLLDLALGPDSEAKLRAAQLQVEQIILGPAGAVGVEPTTYS